MAKEIQEFSPAGLALQRLKHLLERQRQRGFTQVQIAAKAGLPPQYLSDIKRGRRPMTELVARRLGEECGVSFQWLLGISDAMDCRPLPSALTSSSHSVWLPLFPHPIEGEPRVHPRWNGAGMEVAGAIASKLILLKHPYLLQFEHNDLRGRIRAGDLIVISQQSSSTAEIHVVRFRKKSFLARVNRNGSWTRVANGDVLPKDAPVTGHCVGIVWSPLA